MFRQSCSVFLIALQWRFGNLMKQINYFSLSSQIYFDQLLKTGDQELF